MKNLLKLEELSLFGLAAALYVSGYLLSIPWMMFVAPGATWTLQPRPRLRLWLEISRRVPEHAFGQDWKVTEKFK